MMLSSPSAITGPSTRNIAAQALPFFRAKFFLAVLVYRGVVPLKALGSLQVNWGDFVV